MDKPQSEMKPSERLFDLVAKPGEDVYKAADLLDIAHAMANVEVARAALAERVATLEVENARLRTIKAEVERIATLANLNADIYAYDLMRTILAAIGEEP